MGRLTAVLPEDRTRECCKTLGRSVVRGDSQSNWVIAGSLRNIFKYSEPGNASGVGRTLAEGNPRPLEPTNTPA